MQVTNVRVWLANNPGKVRGWAAVELDGVLAVRDIKIIDAGDGLFLAMPCRKSCDFCPDCQEENNVVARFCNWCGRKLAINRARKRPNGKLDLWRDAAYPTTADFREHLENAVLDEYERMADIAEGRTGAVQEGLQQFIAEGESQMDKIEGRYGE